LKELISVLENDIEIQTTAEGAVPETPVQVNERGFMTNPSEWTPGVAWFLARCQGVTDWPREFTNEHWRVIEYTRAYHRATGNAPSLRHTCRALTLTKKRFSRLFPGGPMTVRRIAGLPGPRRSASGRELSLAQRLLSGDWWEHLTGAESPGGPLAGRRHPVVASPVPARSSAAVPVAAKGVIAQQ